jgi:hypothetical protein
MILTLSVHPSRVPDLLSWDRMRIDPRVRANTYHDSFGNFCHVIRAPAGRLTVSTDFLVQDPGELDAISPQAQQHALEDLPVEVLIYLLGSRYCETDRLSDTAWSLFGQVEKGWPLVSAICDYVHARITFGYEHASPTKTAFDAYTEQRGVCRDFAHLAITLCRCMNVPARYCTGYLGDIGLPLRSNAAGFPLSEPAHRAAPAPTSRGFFFGAAFIANARLLGFPVPTGLQLGHTSAPIIPHSVQTASGPRSRNAVPSGQPSASTTALWWQSPVEQYQQPPAPLGSEMTQRDRRAPIWRGASLGRRIVVGIAARIVIRPVIRHRLAGSDWGIHSRATRSPRRPSQLPRRPFHPLITLSS